MNGHVEGSGDTGSSKRLGSLELLAKGHESGHLYLSNLEFLATVVSKGNISNCGQKMLGLE